MQLLNAKTQASLSSSREVLDTFSRSLPVQRQIAERVGASVDSAISLHDVASRTFSTLTQQAGQVAMQGREELSKEGTAIEKEIKEQIEEITDRYFDIQTSKIEYQVSNGHFYACKLSCLIYYIYTGACTDNPTCAHSFCI